MNIKCPYCGRKASFVTSEKFYGRDYGTNLYICRPCDARCGTHGRSDKPLGTMADAELRRYRMKAHRQFDSLWKDGDMTRTEAYAWMQDAMQMTKDEAHIALFDVDQCKRLIKKIKDETDLLFD